MKRLLAILTLTATLFPSGCNNDQQRPREIIILPDLSASIDKQAQQQMLRPSCKGRSCTTKFHRLRREKPMTLICEN